MPRGRGPNAPWNPASLVLVTPEDYEKQVVSWLRETGHKLDRFRVTHLQEMEGSSGAYEFDAVAEFTVFEGARLVVLVECKRQRRAVERHEVLALEAKLRDVGAHKAMLFSTAGFQKGALEYATERRIATITFIDGASTYETRACDSRPAEPPPWVHHPRFAGWFITGKAGKVSSSLVREDRLEPITTWLMNQ